MQRTSQRRLLEVPPGESITIPEHKEAHSTLFITKGEGEIWITDLKSFLCTGWSRRYPSQPKMKIVNTGEDPLELVHNLWIKD